MPNPDSATTPLATGGGLAPIVIPEGSPLVPDWAREAVRRLNLMVASQVASANQKGGYGSNAFVFGTGNAQLLLPAGFTGTLKVTTPTGTALLSFKGGMYQG